MKKILLVLLVIIALGATVSIFRNASVPQSGAPTQINTSSSVTANASATLYETVNPFGDSINFTTMAPIVNTSTGASISFKENNTNKPASANAIADLYVNKQIIGQVGGLRLLKYSFSPDNKYFAAIFIVDAGGGRIGYDLVGASLAGEKKYMIHTAMIEQSYSGDSIPFTDIETRMRFLDWNGSSTLVVTTYVGGTVNTPTTTVFYRISPFEVWICPFADGDIVHCVASTTLPETIPTPGK